MMIISIIKVNNLLSVCISFASSAHQLVNFLLLWRLLQLLDGLPGRSVLAKHSCFSSLQILLLWSLAVATSLPESNIGVDPWVINRVIQSIVKHGRIIRSFKDLIDLLVVPSLLVHIPN